MSKKDITPAEEPKAPAKYEGPTGIADNITSSDLRLPRVALLQSLSPQVQNEPDKYKQGQFMDTLTQNVLTAPIEFTPIFIFKNVIKWKPRAEGGGMIYKTLDFTDPQVLKDIQWDGANKPTADQYINVVVLLTCAEVPSVISFCKTSLKTGQDLLTLVQLSGCAWKYTYLLESVKTTNTKGTFYVMRVKRGTPTSSEQAQNAITLYEQVKGMSIDTDYEGATHEAEPSATAEPSEF